MVSWLILNLLSKSRIRFKSKFDLNLVEFFVLQFGLSVRSDSGTDDSHEILQCQSEVKKSI